MALSQMYLRIQGTLTVSAPPEFQTGGPDIIQQLAGKYGVEIIDSQLEIEVVPRTGIEAEHLGVNPERRSSRSARSSSTALVGSSASSGRLSAPSTSSSPWTCAARLVATRVVRLPSSWPRPPLTEGLGVVDLDPPIAGGALHDRLQHRHYLPSFDAVGLGLALTSNRNSELG